jgi:hypothetical protein
VSAYTAAHVDENPNENVSANPGANANAYAGAYTSAYTDDEIDVQTRSTDPEELQVDTVRRRLYTRRGERDDDKMSGLRMMELMTSDVVAQRGIEIGEVIRPEGTGTEGEDAQVIGDARGREDDR